MTGFSTAFLVDQSPEQAFAAIADVRAWWSGEIDGRTDKLDAEFTYRYENLHFSKQHITEFSPYERVRWRVTDASISFSEDPSEWTGTQVIFDVAPRGDRTEVRFTHLGLVPAFECYEKCSSAWSFYINGSLRRLIATGKGEPSTDMDKTAFV